MPEGDVTGDEFEFISWHWFSPVDYTRTMYWKAGSGSIAVGTQSGVSPERTDQDNSTGRELQAGLGVLVMGTSFKLLRLQD